jgi:hypothetical protein
MAFTPDGRITDRTRYALSAVMPDDVGIFRQHVISQVSELAPSVNAQFVPQGLFTARSTGYSGFAALTETITGMMTSGVGNIMASRAEFIFLAPVGPQVGNEVIYGVYKVDRSGGQIAQVTREDEGFEGVPLMFSTAELRNAQIGADRTSIMRRNQLFRWARTGTEYEGLYDMFDGQVNTDLLLQEN